jgi:hypothetical protein
MRGIPYRKREKDIEDGIVGGIPLSVAMQMVWRSCNKPDTLYIGYRRLKSRLEELRPLLSDPLTSDHAETLRSVVRREKPLDDVIKWLRQMPSATWAEFVQHKKEARHAELLEEHTKFVEELKRRERSACPWCGSKDDVIPILYYGLFRSASPPHIRMIATPKRHLLLFPEHDHYVLVESVGFEISKHWHCKKCGQSF